MKIDFEKNQGLVPVIIQDNITQRVLMLGYMNEEAYQKTTREKKVTFYSRSKQRLWTKGETSGNFLEWTEIMADCDEDTLLIKVKPTGPVCHKGSDTCFEEVNQGRFLEELQGIIRGYKTNPKEDSYTSSLFKKGINKIAQKVGEEAIEVVIEAKDDNPDLFKNECADLLYHWLILLEEKNTSLAEIEGILRERNQKISPKTDR